MSIPSQLIKLWDSLWTRAIPARLRGVFTTRRYANPRLTYFILPYLSRHVYQCYVLDKVFLTHILPHIHTYILTYLLSRQPTALEQRKLATIERKYTQKRYNN